MKSDGFKAKGTLEPHTWYCRACRSGHANTLRTFMLDGEQVCEQQMFAAVMAGRV